ncbi:MAG: YfhO family protein [Candidatus Geothermincolia bacterium]
MNRRPSAALNSKRPRARVAGIAVIAFVVFLAIALALTYPLVTSMSRRIFTPGVSHDGVGTIAQTWFTNYAKQMGWSSKVTTFFAYPFGYDLTSVNYPLTNGLMALMARAVGAQASYNILIILSFPFAGLAMFLLAYYVTKSITASLLSGFLYAFSPWHIFRSFDQVTLAQIYVLPLFLLAVIYLWKKRSVVAALLVTMALAGAVLTDYHFGLFCGLILVTWAFSSWLYDKVAGRKAKAGSHTWRLAVLVVASLLVAAIICAPTIKDLFYKDPAVIADTGERSTDVVVSYSASPLDYVVPPAYSVLWRGLTGKYVAQHLGKSGTHEVTDYPGIITFVLAGVAVFYTFRRKKKPVVSPSENGDDAGDSHARADDKDDDSDPVIVNETDVCSKTVYFGVVTAVTAFILSMPPIVKIKGVSIPTPSIIIRSIAPPFRFYSRWALVVTFSLALMAGVGFYLFTRAREWNSRKTIIACLICALLFAIDVTIVPPTRSQDIATPPATVAALAKYPKSQPVVFYPLSPGRYFIPLWYHYYQMEHKHPMLNGSKPGTLGDEYNSVLKDIYAPYTPAMLKGLNIRKVAVLNNYFKIMFPVGLDFDPAMMPAGYRLDKKTSDGYLFDLVGPGADVFPLYYTNFTPPVILEDGKAWSAMLRPRAELQIQNKAGDTTREFSISFSNPGPEGTISAVLDGISIGKVRVGHGDGELTIPGVHLARKQHILSLAWDGPSVKTDGAPFSRSGDIDVYLLWTRPQFSP